MSGITRIELVIVLLIAAIIPAIGVPALYWACESARRSECKNNLRLLGMGLKTYHDTEKSFPYGCVGNPKFKPSRRWSWYLGLKPLLAQEPSVPLELMKPSDDPRNVPLTFKAEGKEGDGIMTFQLRPPMGTICPNGKTETDKLGQPLATYVGMAGVGRDAAAFPLTNPRAGMWGYDRVTTLDDVKRPQDAVIHVIETATDRGSWYRGGPATVRGVVPGDKPLIGKDGQFGGFHPGVAMTLFVDGHVEALSKRVDATVLRKMATIAADK